MTEGQLSVAERLDLSDMFTAYCGAIDAGHAPDSIAEYYTADGVLDNSAVGSPVVSGQAALQQTFAAMLSAMEGMEHYLSNFIVLSASGKTATASCYVQAYAKPKGGEAFTARGKYQIEARYCGEDGAEEGSRAEWKLARLTFTPAS